MKYQRRRVLFQSLIGRLRTVSQLVPVVSGTPFQSLIGRLRTSGSL